MNSRGLPSSPANPPLHASRPTQTTRMRSWSKGGGRVKKNGVRWSFV